MGAGASDLVSDLVNSSTLAALGVAVALALGGAVARRVAPERFQGWPIAAAAVFAVVLAVTQLPTTSLTELTRPEFAGSVERAVTWPLDGIDRDTTFAAAGWWLNIVLFVPLGLCVRGTLRGRPAWWSAITTAVAAALVESGQGFTGWRSTDLADFIANSAGGAIGVALVGPVTGAANALWRALGRPRGRRLAAIVGVTGGLAVATAALVLVTLADQAQDALLDELRDRYGDTDLDAMHDVFFASDDEFVEFLAATSVRPDSVVRRTAPDAVQVRYTEPFFGLQRCVFVIWHAGGVDFEEDRGSRCTDFLGS